MGWRKKETKPVPSQQDTGTMPERKHMEKSPSTIFKLVCYTLFDNSPASALKILETTGDAVRGLPALTPSKKQLSSPQRTQLEWLKPVTAPQAEASSSETVDYEVERKTNRSHSLPGSTQHGGGKFLKVFKRKSSKSILDGHVTNHSNQSSPDGSNRDIYYNGDVSSNSLFEIEVDSDEKSIVDTQFRRVVNRLESEVDVLRRRLEKEEQEVKKLKDEVSTLRSSSASSHLQSPSDLDTARSSNESSGSFKFDTVMSLLESPRTSTSDKFDGNSQRYMEFCPSDEGQLTLVQEEQSRSRNCTPEVSDDDLSLPDAQNDVNLVRRSSLSKEDLEQYCSELMHKHMDTFLSDVAALGKRETLEKYFHNGRADQGIGSQPPEGQGHLILADQSSKGNEPSLDVVSNVSEENCFSDDGSTLELAEDAVLRKDTGRVHFVSTDRTSEDLNPFGDTLGDERKNNDESSLNFVKRSHAKSVHDEKVESEQLREDSEWLSQEFGGLPPKKEGLKVSIMDYGIPADPESAERRRQVQHRYQELEEKLMKILRSPRRDNSYRSTSYSSSSGSSSGTSSPRSNESGSSRGSFSENDHSLFKVDSCENGCLNGCCYPFGDGLATLVKSDVQASKVTKSLTKDLDLELYSPRDILVGKFDSRAKTRSLYPPSQLEISEEEMDITSSVVREVYFHPILSRAVSLSALSGYKQQKDSETRGGETHPVDLDISKDSSAATKVEERAEVPVVCQPTSILNAVQGNVVWDSGNSYNADSNGSDGNYVRRFQSSGSRRSRFGEEAERLAVQRQRSVVQPGSHYTHNYPKYVM